MAKRNKQDDSQFLILALLWFFFGGFGMHKVYAKRQVHYIFWYWIPTFFTLGILWIYDGFKLKSLHNAIFYDNDDPPIQHTQQVIVNIDPSILGVNQTQNTDTNSTKPPHYTHIPNQTVHIETPNKKLPVHTKK